MLDLSCARRTMGLSRSEVLHSPPYAARHVLRGAPDVMAAASQALGLTLSLPPCRASSNSTLAALWLGPDERLLLGEESSAHDTVAKLKQALREQPHSLVDVSHRQTAMQVSGPHASRVLNAGCPLDL